MTPLRAFVAMRFTGPANADRRYLAIKEVCSEAGYDTVRSDEISTSGPVVDEVARLLCESDLVVADSSGGSHSVSYEIGYCHGVGRPPETTILLRNSPDIPFNYRHFRHEIYKNATDIKRILRSKLGILEPPRNRDFGYVFSFLMPREEFGFEDTLAKCIVECLVHFSVSGRVEYYTHSGFIRVERGHTDDSFPEPFANSPFVEASFRQTPMPNSERFYRVGLGIRSNGRAPDYTFWRDLSEFYGHLVEKRDSRIQHCDTMSELARMEPMRQELRLCGAAELTEGRPTRVIDPFKASKEGPFRRALGI